MDSTPSDPKPARQLFHDDGELIRSILCTSEIVLAEPFETLEDADRLQAGRGDIFAKFIVDPSRAKTPVKDVERLLAVASPATLARLSVVDRAGHRRPVYRPLLAYCWLQSFRLGYELLPRSEFGRWDEATRTWCDDLEFRLSQFNWPATDSPAAVGDQIAEVCWIALALHVAGKIFIRDAWTDLAADVFGKLARRQRESGALLTATAADNPETFWFHELATLHAAASYAVQAEDRALATVVAKATRFHSREIQPDHATSQPWGVFAFLWNPETRSFGEGMLHAMQSSGSEVSRMLLADALYCLRLFA